MKICVSIASYRDPDLINTVNSCYENAVNKDDISFCIVSQAEDDEHADLSHIPRVSYYKYHWSQSRGVCWARNIAINKSKGDYILQVDSHSRFKPGWDETIDNLYTSAVEFWGDKIILTQFPDSFEVEDGEIKYSDMGVQLKTYPEWIPEENRFGLGENWLEIDDQIHGDEIFYFAAGCTFAESKIYKSIAPDPDIYFEDQMSIAIRAYTRGYRLINPPDSFVYSNYDRSFNNRRLHWDDNEGWEEIDNKSEIKLQRLYRGDLEGFFGIKSKSLYNQFCAVNNIDFSYEYEQDEEENEEDLEGGSDGD